MATKATIQQIDEREARIQESDRLKAESLEMLQGNGNENGGGASAPQQQTTTARENATLADAINAGSEIEIGDQTFTVTKWIAKDYVRLSQLLLDLNLDFDVIAQMKPTANFMVDLMIMKADIIFKILAYTLKVDLAFIENAEIYEVVGAGVEVWSKNSESFFRTWKILQPVLQKAPTNQPQEASPPQNETEVTGSTSSSD